MKNGTDLCCPVNDKKKPNIKVVSESKNYQDIINYMYKGKACVPEQIVFCEQGKLYTVIFDFDFSYYFKGNSITVIPPAAEKQN